MKSLQFTIVYKIANFIISIVSSLINFFFFFLVSKNFPESQYVSRIGENIIISTLIILILLS